MWFGSAHRLCQFTTSPFVRVKVTSGLLVTGRGTPIRKNITGYPARGSWRPSQACFGLLVIGAGLMTVIGGIQAIGLLGSDSTAGLIMDTAIQGKAFTVAGGKEIPTGTTPR